MGYLVALYVLLDKIIINRAEVKNINIYVLISPV